MAQDIEDVLDDVESYWDAQIENILLAIESARSVTIPRIKSKDTVELKKYQFPSLEILPGRTTTRYVYPDGPQGVDDMGFEEHVVLMQFAHDGGTPVEVQKTLLRYREATRKLVKKDRTFGGAFVWVRLVTGDYGPMRVAQEKGRMLQVMQQALLVRTLLEG